MAKQTGDDRFGIAKLCSNYYNRLQVNEIGQSTVETPLCIEPARLEDVPEAVFDRMAELAAASTKLGHGLHPQTAANLAGLVRLINTHYSNLIEGITRP